jgi:uncharacterized protein YkwD
MPRRFTIATALAVLFTSMLGSAGPASAAAKNKKPLRACAGAFAIPTAGTLPRAHDAVLCLINRQRARRRVSALRRSAELTRAAVAHSTDMIDRQYFAHQSLDGAMPRQRVLRSGYFRGAAGGTVEETLAAGWQQLSTPKALVASLMRSKSHKTILLSRSLRDVGIGLVLGAPQPGMAGGATLTLDLARR